MKRPQLQLSIPLLILSLALGGCDAGRPANAQAKSTQPEARRLRESEAAPASRVAALSDSMRASFGAASWIPEDGAFFCSMSRLREQWDLVAKSRAVAGILQLPTVQMGLEQLRQHPYLRQFERQRESSPFFRALVDLAVDAVSHEVFLYADAEWVEVTKKLNEVYASAYFLALSEAFFEQASLESPEGRNHRRQARVRSFLTALAESAEGLRMPPLVLGFRLKEPKAAAEVLEALVAQLAATAPVKIDRETIEGGTYHTARFDASTMAPVALARIGRQLRRTGVTQQTVEKLMRTARSQTLAISAGVRGDYLLFAVGADTEHLKRLGAERSLAASAAFAPVRQKLKPRMIALSYLDKSLGFFGGKIDPDEVDAGLAELLKELSSEASVPDGLPRRIRRDARALIEDLNQALPKAEPTVHVIFLNRGLESYTFHAYMPGSWDSTKPLSILSRAGAEPLLAYARRWTPMGATCERAGHWAGVAYGYFKDFVLESLEPSERAHVDEFESVFLVSLKKLWATTVDELVPALDGGEGLLLADGAGVLTRLPGDRRPLSDSVWLPRPALVLEVRDATRLKRAFTSYRETINEMFRRVEDLDGTKQPRIPEPESRSHAGGVLYTYSLPRPLKRMIGVEPHVLLTSRYAVVSLLPDQSEAIVKTATSPSSPTVPMDAPAGAVLRVDVGRIIAMIFRAGRVALQYSADHGRADPRAVSMAWMHLPALEQALGTLKSFTSRSHRTGGLTVSHSWLHVEDLADDD